MVSDFHEKLQFQKIETLWNTTIPQFPKNVDAIEICSDCCLIIIIHNNRLSRHARGTTAKAMVVQWHSCTRASGVFLIINEDSRFLLFIIILNQRCHQSIMPTPHALWVLYTVEYLGYWVQSNTRVLDTLVTWACPLCMRKPFAATLSHWALTCNCFLYSIPSKSNK